MNDKYLVFTGNEFGMGMDNYHGFLSLEKAEEMYQEYLEEYECAAMYILKDDGIELVKNDYTF